MNLKQWQIFREIAKTGNFTKAAQNLFITQSAVSHAMKELETEAGTQFFERLHRSVKLTPAGELLLQEIRPILEDIESVEARLPNLEGQSPIKIASCITFAQTGLPYWLHKFKEKQPTAQFQVQVSSAADSVARLEAGEVDLAFIEGTVRQPAFNAQKIAEYSLIVVTAGGEAIKTLEFSELLQYPLLLRERGSAVRETFESYAVLQGTKIFPTWESVDSQALISAVKAGLGISVLPDLLVAEELARGTLQEIQVTDWQLTNDITALIRPSRYHTRLLADFWQLLG